MDRRDIEFNAEGVILRGWLYRGEGASGQTWATCSVNVCRGHVSTRQRQRRLRHCTCAISPPHGRSRGRVSTHSFPDVDQRAAGRPRLGAPNRPNLRLPGQDRRAAKHGKHLLDVLVMLTEGQPWLPATS